MARFIYRDTRTGRFGKKSAWKRDKAKGGKRYKREKWKHKEPPPPPLPPGIVWEWIVAFKYDRTGKSFDVIVTATSETEAYDVAIRFLRADPTGQRILTPTLRLKRGWHGVPVRANVSTQDVGEAEYREESEEE